jgi:UDP-N-acetylglucosamine transferase subunit ALG13
VIFVTVGTQLGFDRLIRAVDVWAAAAGGGREVFAQIGPGDYVPRHMKYSPFISPQECLDRMAHADAIVAHAGMGTILSALELAKPVLVMPRQAALGEHRNDHQLATARRLAALGHVSVAADERELALALDGLGDAQAAAQIGPHASDRLLDAISRFIAA